MKKNTFTEFFKGKGYFVLLFVGVIAIAAVALIGSQISSNQNNGGDSYIDLNEPNNNIAAVDDDNQLADNNTIPEGIVNNGQDDNLASGVDTNDNTGLVVADNDSLIEFDVFTEEEENGIDLSHEVPPTEVAQTEVEKEQPPAVAASGKTVKADSASNLSFKAEDGLLWPVSGNVLMNYSMDHTIYYATLMQYKCNPAIIIDAEVGTEVKAAARGVISSIDKNEETGLTVTTNIGDGFSLVYGQLDNVNLEVGDRINEGEILGTIKEPTKYYSVEGSNLYFKVLDNEQTVNPMLYLR